jgi:hypothetical protein
VALVVVEAAHVRVVRDEAGRRTGTSRGRVFAVDLSSLGPPSGVKEGWAIFLKES